MTLNPPPPIWPMPCLPLYDKWLTNKDGGTSTHLTRARLEWHTTKHGTRRLLTTLRRYSRGGGILGRMVTLVRLVTFQSKGRSIYTRYDEVNG